MFFKTVFFELNQHFFLQRLLLRFKETIIGKMKINRPAVQLHVHQSSLQEGEALPLQYLGVKKGD